MGRFKSYGFTLVELMIVIAVIAILASVTIVAYNGIQGRSRDAARHADVKIITDALKLYYFDNGYYPNITTYTPGGSVGINANWSTTADGSWANLAAVLAPYVKTLPRPPGTASTTAAIYGGNSYDYFGFQGSYCNVAAGQGYLLAYRLEGTQVNTYVGTCSGSAVGPYAQASNYRLVRN